MQQFEEKSGGDVESGGGNDIERRDSNIGKIDSLDVEDRLAVAFGQFDFPVEQFWGIFDEVRAKISVDDGVATSWKEKNLWNHKCSEYITNFIVIIKLNFYQ